MRIAQYRKACQKIEKIEDVASSVAMQQSLHIKKSQRANRASTRPEESVPTSRDTALEMVEVVLPSHQNHMGHTFGGAVMHWMHSAASVCAARHAGNADTLRTTAIHRISFASGSDVSDHLVFRAMVNAVFPETQTMEVGVRVSRRNIATGEERKMNSGYFVFSRTVSVDSKTSTFWGRNQASQAQPSRLPAIAEPEDEDARERMSRATTRHRLLMVNRALMTSTGGAFEWTPELEAEVFKVTFACVWLPCF